MIRKLITLISLLSVCLIGVSSCATVPDGCYSSSVSGGKDFVTIEEGISPAILDDAAIPSAEIVGKLPPPETPTRLKIYTADLTLIVDNVYEIQKRIKYIAEQKKGFLQTMDNSSIVIKVPAATFEDVVRQIETMGEVTKRKVATQDVTEQVQALHITLDNTEKLRKRLLKLLEDTVKIEDAIKIEQELARLTETIEQIEGAIRSLKHRVTYSTITVNLNSPVPQRMTKDVIPFDWVRALARNMDVKEDDRYFRVVVESDADFDLPSGFATFYANNYSVRATSPDGIYLRVKHHTNAENADLNFWSKLISRSLKDGAAMNITATRNIKLDDGTPAVLIEGTRDIDTRKIAYAVLIALTKEPWLNDTRRVYVYEAWGPEEAVKTAMPEIEQSMKTMKVNTWYRKIYLPGE
jgi:hypothetical protein